MGAARAATFRPTLADVPVGSPVVLGRPEVEPDQRRRLAKLGLRAGAEVTVLLRTAGGGRVVAVAEDRIALDRGTLARMPLDGPHEHPVRQLP